MLDQVSKQKAFVRPSERELVDHLVEHISEHRREVVVNYYVALKAKRFVILAGPADVNKMCLPQGLAETLARSRVHWSSLQAHPWWTTGTGASGYFALLHAQLNTLKLHDLIEAASAAEAAGPPTPFFVDLKQMSPAEVVCYFEDLPRGLLWLADGSSLQVQLPDNLFVTGSLEVEGRGDLVLGEEVHRHATVIEVHEAGPASRAGLAKTLQGTLDWQEEFTRSDVRHMRLARAKLTRILPPGTKPLSPFLELQASLGGLNLSPYLLQDTWLYLSNAFDLSGCGLFVASVTENLQIAQDYVFGQIILPYLRNLWPEGSEMWRQVAGLLEPQFPRSYAQVQRLLVRVN